MDGGIVCCQRSAGLSCTGSPFYMDGQISIDGDRFARHFDERGVERLVSIKKMPWAKITELEERGDVMEVRYLTLTEV